jgi:hypothetical protein
MAPDRAGLPARWLALGKIIFFVVAKGCPTGFCWIPVGGQCLQPQRSPFMAEKKSIKHIFVTGGVVSSLGKGLTAAALGALLEQRGLKIPT